MKTSPIESARVREPISVSESQGLAKILQTIGDPTRLRILTALESVCISVTSITEVTGLRQPSVSHHLRILRDRGLVIAERRGGFVYYCLANEGLRGALEELRQATMHESTPAL